MYCLLFSYKGPNTVEDAEFESYVVFFLFITTHSSRVLKRDKMKSHRAGATGVAALAVLLAVITGNFTLKYCITTLSHKPLIGFYILPQNIIKIVQNLNIKYIYYRIFD